MTSKEIMFRLVAIVALAVITQPAVIPSDRPHGMNIGTT